MSPELEQNPVYQVHKKYWTYNAEEKDKLLAKTERTTKENLRLLHLILMGYFESEEGREHLHDEDSFDEEDWDKDTQSQCKTILDSLIQGYNPFRPKQCYIWQGEIAEEETQNPDMQGKMINASLTHLGCVEVIRLDEENNPTEVDFIPLDDLSGIMFAQPSIYRAAKIFYDTEEPDEVVYIPLIYGLSWYSNNEFDHDGSITRFCCNMETDHPLVNGVGIGMQDFAFVDTEDNQSMLGLVSMSEIMVGLELDDPRFEEKCQLRGVDPDEIRARFTLH
jgi:hypothetical protein